MRQPSTAPPDVRPPTPRSPDISSEAESGQGRMNVWATA